MKNSTTKFCIRVKLEERKISTGPTTVTPPALAQKLCEIICCRGYKILVRVVRQMLGYPTRSKIRVGLLARFWRL